MLVLSSLVSRTLSSPHPPQPVTEGRTHSSDLLTAFPVGRGPEIHLLVESKSFLLRISLWKISVAVARHLNRNHSDIRVERTQETCFPSGREEFDSYLPLLLGCRLRLARSILQAFIELCL